MRPLEIGLVPPMGDSFVDGSTMHWPEIRDLAVRAEAIGFDTVWFGEAGFDHLEVVPWPPTIAALDAMTPVLERLDASESRAGAGAPP
jgi:alkanesulfonate monooxygenase SsuD/methylene tetrahydromethanopterin reductase-like flavin-dependent oxidoreductase (luciferase family)